MATPILSGTDIRILREVPFNSDYKHTRYFDKEITQRTYFQNKPRVHQMTQANFQIIEGKNFIAVNKSIDSLWGANYIMFQNEMYSSKWFYAFVTKLEYKQKNTTYVHFEIDVYQTWLFQLRWKPSYIIREHCKLWHSNGFPVVNTIDEGLDYGTEYDVINTNHFKRLNGHKFMVIVSKVILHEGSIKGEITPSVIGVPQPLTYYIVPFNANNPNSKTMPLIKTDVGPSWACSPVSSVLKALYESEDAVNAIVSIYVTEDIGADTTLDTEGGVWRIRIRNATISRVLIESKEKSVFAGVVNNIDDFVPKIHKIYDNKYSAFRKPKESKLLMYPYSVITLDDYRGNQFTLRPEYISGLGLSLITLGSMGTANKNFFGVMNYNTGSLNNYHSRKLSLEHGLLDINTNDVPVLTDHLASFLQGNKNSIQNQKNTIDFNKNMSLLNSGTQIAQGALMSNPIGMIGGVTSGMQGLGNSVLQMQAIQAKQSDIDNVPPSLSKMGGNSAFDFGNRYDGVWISHRQIKAEYREKLEDFFSAYGYRVDRIKIPNFKTRQHFNFIQTKSCVINGNLNNQDLMKIRQIFDNGITLWHTDDIGNYNLSNGVR